jgi:GNAT superfamily N-acetyltransferase
LWVDDLTVTEAFITSHPVHCAVTGSDILGFYALSNDGSTFELEHMWVYPPHIGTGVGRALFEHAVRTVRTLGGAVLRIGSDPNAVGFYRTMGARLVGEVPSKPQGRSLPLLELVIG